MKKFKVTFFNPETLHKRELRFTFRWDYLNHCWDVTTTSIHGQSTRKYSGDPINMIMRVKECATIKEYATVKTVA